MFNKINLLGIAVICMWGQLVVAAELTTFEGGDPISATEINDNFTALNDELPVVNISSTSGIGTIQIGDILIVGGKVSVPFVTSSAPIDGVPVPGVASVSFQTNYLATPVVVISEELLGGAVNGYIAPSTLITNVTTSGFQILNYGNTKYVHYSATGPIAAPTPAP